MTSRTEPAAGPASDADGTVPFDAFVDLVEALRLDGFPIGLERYEAVRTLVVRLHALGEAPAAIDGWRTRLAPVLCSTAAQQRRFDVVFAAWAARLRARGSVDALRVSTRGVRSRRAPFVVAAAVLVAAGVLVLAWPRPSPRPIAKPTVPAAPVADAGGRAGPAAPAPAGGDAPAPVLAMKEVFPVVIGAPEPAAFAASAPFWTTGRVGALAGAIALSLGLLALLLRRQALVRGAARDAVLAELWSVPVPKPPVVRVTEVARWARPLRARVAVGTSALDVPATIDATVAAAGWWTPVVRDDLTTVEYVVLIDRRSRGDLGARWAFESIDALRAAQVALDVYEFDGDPRTVRPAGGGPTCSLAEVHARHDRSRLWVVSAAERILDPTTGHLDPAWGALARFDDRTLVTPEPVAEWGERERAARESGLRVVPAAWVGGADAMSAPPAEVEPLPPLPPRLRDARRLTSADAPPPAEFEALARDLSRALDADGRAWLSACAVYPELRWELTLYLGGTLVGARGRPVYSRERLARLARLPWFREGRMPDWMRRRLLDEMPRGLERRVRAALDGVLSHARGRRADAGTMPLEIADPRSRRSDAGPGAASGSSRTAPLRDVLYRRYMDDRLSVRIPRRLRRHPRLVRAAAVLLLLGLPAVAVAVHAAWTSTSDASRSLPILAADAVEFLKGFAEPVGLGTVGAIEPETGYPRRIRRIKDGAEMALVPAGTFQMGAVPQDDFAEADEKPRHWVTITRPYYMDVVEVTNERFDRVAERIFPGAPASQRSFFSRGSLPVADVSHATASLYAKDVGCELPTEAQFERAMRAGREGTTYPWGDETTPPKGAGNLPDEARFRATQMATIVPDYDDGFSEVAPVGSFPPNAYGLQDLVGNAREWCRETYQADAYATSSLTDPDGPSPLFTDAAKESKASARGGSFTYQAVRLAVDAATCSARTPELTSARAGDASIGDVGFRCVRSIPAAQSQLRPTVRAPSPDLDVLMAARPALERALAMQEKALGPDHPDVATSLDALAANLEASGAYAVARPLIERALGIREEALGRADLSVAVSYDALAANLEALGAYDEARGWLLRSLAIREMLLGKDHLQVAVSRRWAGSIPDVTKPSAEGPWPQIGDVAADAAFESDIEVSAEFVGSERVRANGVWLARVGDLSSGRMRVPGAGVPTLVIEIVDRGRVLGPAIVRTDATGGWSEPVRKFLDGFARPVGSQVDVATGYPRKIRRLKDDGEMVLIPAGTFQMGAVPGDTSAEKHEKPRHAVTLSRAYYLDVNEVTVGQWKKFVGGGGGRLPMDLRSEATDTHPIHNVDHEEAKAFARWAGASLPTEAQWERAAKGGHDEFVYPWGATDDVKMRNGVGGEDGFPGHSPVRFFAPNAYGLYDMSGNVIEWCADWFELEYFGTSPAQDPPGPGSGDKCVVRGGSWQYDSVHLRASHRLAFAPLWRNEYGGFRLARTL